MKMNVSVLLLLTGLVAAYPVAAQLKNQFPTDSPKSGLQIKPRASEERATTMLSPNAAISVKQIAVTVSEFPPITASQYKVGFECVIKAAKQQTKYSDYPRYRCQLDQTHTGQINGLNIHRVDSFPSIDGLTNKIILVADKGAKNPNPGRIRAAFQLFHDKTDTQSVVVLKDYVFADGLLNKQ